MELPIDRPLTDDELAATVAQAIIDPQFNPGSGHPFNAEAPYYVNCLLGQQEAMRVQGDIFNANGEQNELSARIAELCWRWTMHGLLVPVGGRDVGQFQPTARGREFFADVQNDALLSLSDGWLVRTLRERCPGIDEITLAYAGLAHDCFLTGLYEPSVVMLGAAAETAVNRLIDALNDHAATLGTPVITASSARLRLDDLATLLVDHKKQLRAALGERGGWVIDLPGLLRGGNAIRLTRNDVGHPQRLVGRREEAQGQITIFPQLAEALTMTTVGVEAFA